MPVVYVENENGLILQMFVNRDWGWTNKLEEADLVCFEGGADVSPELYGEENVSSHNSVLTDWNSIILYNNAKRLAKPMVGICRGGQFLNVMAGGKMKQHVDGHAISGTHEMIYVHDSWYDEGEYNEQLGHIQVTSTHHQMMVVNTDVSDMIGWAGESEPEIVYHWADGNLSFQPHPEYVDKGHECQEHFFELLEFYFDLKA